MGLFGGIGKALKGIDWGNAMAGLQSAGAIAQGDYGTAAQIQGLRRRERDEQQQAEAQRAAMQQAIQALVARGVPEQEARIIAQGGGADALLGQHNAPQQGNEYTYFDDNAGNRWRQNSRTGAVDQQPSFIDRNPRTFFDPAQNRVVEVPNSYAQSPPPPPRPGGGQQAAQDPITFEMYRGAVNGLGEQDAGQWLQRNDHIVAVRTPQEARQLPRGTRIRLPDGSEGRVP